MDIFDHTPYRKTTRRAYFSAVFTLCFLFLWMSFTPVQAYTGKDKIPPLSYKVKESVKDYRLRSDEYNITPLEDRSLNFKIRLPQGWTPLDSDLNKGDVGGDIFRLLAMYTSPANIMGRSQFRVRSIDIHYLTSANNWIIAYMLDMGFSLEGMHVFSRRKVEAQYTLFINDTPYIIRAVVELSGSRVVIAEYMVPQDNYEESKDEQILAMNNFELLSPDLSPAVEMKTFSFVDIARFDYPGAWNLIAPVITNIDDMSVTLANVFESGVTVEKKAKEFIPQLNGRIDISIIARNEDTKLEDQISTLHGEMATRKIKIMKLIETVNDVEIKSIEKKVRIDVYAVEGTEAKLVDHEYWGAVLQTPGHYYLVRLITVGRLQNFKVWSQNVETLRYVIGSLAPNKDVIE